MSQGAPPRRVETRRPSSNESQPAWDDKELRVLAASLALTIAVGTAFYQVVEGWSSLDAVYFSVVTLATVGFGDITPRTPLGKLFTMAYIVVGIGLLAGFAQVLARRFIDRRLRRITEKQTPPESWAPRARRALKPISRVRRARRRAASEEAAQPTPLAETTPAP